jgi:hypothetical protein
MAIRQVVCMKWGDKFAADDVNRLHRRVRSHIQGDLRMLCFTDDARGIDPEVECHPLPAVPVVGDRHDRGWRKLGLFGAELAALLEGPVLYLDLDIAIVQRLESFFDWPGEFLIIKDFKPLRYRHRFSGNSSVIRFHAGAHQGLIAELLQRGARIREDFRDEQEFASDYMRRQGVLQYWPSGWCASFKHDCVRPLPLGLWQEPQLPDGAKVLVFHGCPKPDEAIIGIGSKWYRPLLPAPWLRRYLE